MKKLTTAACSSIKEAPFLHVGDSVKRMAFWTWCGLTVLAVVYAARYDWNYLKRYFIVMLIAAGLEIAWRFLEENKLALKSGSSLVSAAILQASLPPDFPMLHLFFGLIVTVAVIRMNAKPVGIFLNPALAGRLFLMIAYRSETVAWGPDDVTAATPLDLYHSEGTFIAAIKLFFGYIREEWDMYTVVPSGPGENFIFLILGIGVLLYLKGVLDWRPGISFLLAFAVTIALFREPVIGNLLSGAVVFASVFIAGDPRSTPATRSGRLVAGGLAGVGNACIRHYQPDNYGEGIVFAFLAVNLLSPLIDRLMFTLRGRYLASRRQHI